jgi:tetratricopeptide (TPR) repeat protein
METIKFTKTKTEIIEAYLNGDMNEQEKIMFEAWAAKDTDFLDDVEIHRQFSLIDDDKIKFLTAVKKAEAKHRRDSQIKRFASPRWLRVAAAILLIAAVSSPLLLYMNRTSTNRLYKEYYSSYETTQISRGADNESIFNDALNAFSSKEYQKAGEMFSKILLSETSNYSAAFYKAMCQMELENYETAIEIFNTLIKDETNLFVEQSHWYIALGYVKTNNISMAKKHLEILQSYDNPYNEKAVKLISKLNSL